jgi:hypothetical protein
MALSERFKGIDILIITKNQLSDTACSQDLNWPDLTAVALPSQHKTHCSKIQILTNDWFLDDTRVYLSKILKWSLLPFLKIHSKTNFRRFEKMTRIFQQLNVSFDSLHWINWIFSRVKNRWFRVREGERGREREREGVNRRAKEVSHTLCFFG